MSDLRANTDIMRNGASIITKAAGSLGGIVGRVNGWANQIGGEYQGQLRDKVRPIISSLAGLGTQVGNRSEEAGTLLVAKATEIDAVMQSSNLSAASTLAPSTMSPLARFFNGVSQLTLGGLAAILSWIGLGQTRTPVTNIPQRPVQVDVGVYQNDPRWAAEPMGPNGTMEEYGCLVTALTMIARYHGVNITPKDFNNWLRDSKNGGYVNGSNLNWSKAQEYLNSLGLNGRIENINLNGSDHGVGAINSELSAGRPVVLHVPGPNKDDGHYVLAVPPPRNDNTFLAYDPWSNDPQSASKPRTFSIDQVEGAKSFH